MDVLQLSAVAAHPRTRFSFPPVDVVAAMDGLQRQHRLRDVKPRDLLAQDVLPHQQRLRVQYQQTDMLVGTAILPMSDCCGQGQQSGV